MVMHAVGERTDQNLTSDVEAKSTERPPTTPTMSPPSMTSAPILTTRSLPASRSSSSRSLPGTVHVLLDAGALIDPTLDHARGRHREHPRGSYEGSIPRTMSASTSRRPTGTLRPCASSCRSPPPTSAIPDHTDAKGCTTPPAAFCVR
ncbi:hypothetical protein Taro_010572, partial [Colocasia esculenta]|nr:hypothetical protein [Colocasia esculenta]